MPARITSRRIIGRDLELARLEMARAEATQRRSRTVLIAGEAGVGKTRLTDAWADIARMDGSLVVGGGAVGFGGADLPFGPIVEILRGIAEAVGPERFSDATGPFASDVLALVPDILPSAGPVAGRDPLLVRHRSFAGIAAMLGRLSAERPICLIVEDIHWSDRSTLDILAYLVRTLSSERVMLVATFRSDELHRRHPLLPWLAEVERTRVIERIELDRLDRASIGRLVADIRGSDDEKVVTAIWERSHGNPFLAEEILEAARETSDPTGTVATAVPRPVADVIRARIDRLSIDAREVLDVLAVGGDAVDHDDLVAVTRRPSTEIEAAVSEGIEAGILASHSPGTDHRFRHALGREAVYDEILPATRRRLHAAYARTLEERGGRAHDVAPALVAAHWSAAQAAAEALAAWIAAGRDAERRVAFTEAATAWDRAIELWEQVSPERRPADVDDLELLDRARHAAAYLDRHERALELAVFAASIARERENPGRASSSLAFAARISWFLLDTARGIAYAQAAIDAVGDRTRSTDLANALHSLAGLLVAIGRSALAEPIARDAVEVGAASGDSWVQSFGMAQLAETRIVDDPHEALDLLDAAARVHLSDRTPVEQADAGSFVLSVRSTALAAAGRREEAIAALDRIRELASATGTAHLYEVEPPVRAELLVAAGRWEEARRICEGWPTTGQAVVVAFDRAFLALLDARQGRLAQAADHVAWLTPRLERNGGPQYVGPTRIAELEIALLEGRPEDAIARLGVAFEPFTGTDQHLWATALIATGARAAADSAERAVGIRDADGAESARSFVRGLVAGPLAEHIDHGLAWVGPIAAYAATTAAELARAEGRDEPSTWAAVRAAWLEVDQPWDVAYAGRREGEALVRAGRRAEAARVLADARAVTTRLGAEPLRREIEAIARRARLTLELASAGVAPIAAETAATGSTESPSRIERLGLSPRELEVLALLTEGYTNRRIADNLFISPHTAGVHVAHILDKLGVDSRVEAAAIAARLGVDAGLVDHPGGRDEGFDDTGTP